MPTALNILFLIFTAYLYLHLLHLNMGHEQYIIEPNAIGWGKKEHKCILHSGSNRFMNLVFVRKK